MTKILSARIPDALYDALVADAAAREMTLTAVVIERLSGMPAPAPDEIQTRRNGARRPRRNEIVVGPGLEDF